MERGTRKIEREKSDRERGGGRRGCCCCYKWNYIHVEQRELVATE